MQWSNTYFRGAVHVISGFLLAGVLQCAAQEGNPCVEARSCHECITTHPACAWCEDEDYDETKDRCSLIGNLAWSCRKFAVPKNDLKILRSELVRDPSAGRRAIQLEPQEIKIKLRPNMPATFQLTFRLARVPERQVEIDAISFKADLADSSDIAVKFIPACNQSAPETDPNTCEALDVGVKVTTEVSVTAFICPDDVSKRTSRFKIYPYPFRTDRLDVTVDLICECECEKPEYAMQSSQKCSGSGTYACRACLCDPGVYGKWCECDPTSDDISMCYAPDSDIICSGRGECICGACHCFPRRAHSAQRYTGDYCQCDDYSCSFYDMQLCGGSDRGTCVCGDCECRPGYTGEACECPLSNQTCITTNGLLCNGVGVCECGVCKCDPSSSYKGPTCEECPTCPGKCTENKNCALCRAFQTGPLSAEECETKCSHVVLVPYIDKDVVIENDNVNMCQYLDEEDDCMYSFTYRYLENNDIAVQVQSTKECSPPSTTATLSNDPSSQAVRTMSYFLLLAIIVIIGYLMLLVPTV